VRDRPGSQGDRTLAAALALLARSVKHGE
jgi:hypothetical protein